MSDYSVNRTALLRLVSHLTSNELEDLCFSHFEAIYDIFTPGMNASQRRRELLQWVIKHRQVELMVELIQAISPAAYEEYKKEVALSQPPEPTPAPGDFNPERIFHEQLQHIDVRKWRAEMILAEVCVCRIEQPEGMGWGTGFLIADDQILTCWHVLEAAAGKTVGNTPRPARETVAALSNMVVRFDYKFAADNVSLSVGRTCRLASDTSWLVGGNSDLDYAILRLDEAPGRDVIQLPESVEATRQRARSHLHLPVGQSENGAANATQTTHRFYSGEPLMILQHPKAHPMKYGVASVVGIDQSQPSRVLHIVNTEGGSSGSPCFTFDWQLVAMHQGAGNGANFALPIELIARDLAALTGQKA